MTRFPARAWLGSFGLHAAVIFGLLLASWTLWVRAEPVRPPVLEVQASPPSVAAEAPLYEVVEPRPPTEAPPELEPAELEPTVFADEASPLEAWPVPHPWIQDPEAYRDARRPTSGLRRVEAPQQTPPITRVAPPPLRPVKPPAAAAPEPAARSQPAPDLAHCPEPSYPVAAQRRGYEGVVTLLVAVDPAGRVTEVRVVETSGYGVLDRAAREAVRAWRFHPAEEDGQAVAGTTRVPIRFRLVDQGARR